ncbi:uncharacterized protein B0I36DRAFT_361474 [Microdochium trichocladiopsis]|uniref:Hydrophobic surface binding protein A-domain-containing protein n=1 Tax=Microdochium trichocladiopsis TaxID=1682393 RepID=A0A9P8YAB4_9PEZI|nr:uncharacterized protein B0I36DRAFT_361474 [Microdochium trichocladiopsis]KAH7032699.1 hypothetical protein B0I36DRAFT_361474 [Microdochium trichocladiopsis]
MKTSTLSLIACSLAVLTTAAAADNVKPLLPRHNKLDASSGAVLAGIVADSTHIIHNTAMMTATGSEYYAAAVASTLLLAGSTPPPTTSEKTHAETTSSAGASHGGSSSGGSAGTGTMGHATSISGATTTAASMTATTRKATTGSEGTAAATTTVPTGVVHAGASIDSAISAEMEAIRSFVGQFLTPLQGLADAVKIAGNRGNLQAVAFGTVLAQLLPIIQTLVGAI